MEFWRETLSDSLNFKNLGGVFNSCFWSVFFWENTTVVFPRKIKIVNDNKIINSTSPDPFLTVPELEIKYFQKEITLLNLINETNIESIINTIEKN